MEQMSQPMAKFYRLAVRRSHCATRVMYFPRMLNEIGGLRALTKVA
jgi:hypothetical protein